jgi:hypothetical protein
VKVECEYSGLTSWTKLAGFASHTFFLSPRPKRARSGSDSHSRQQTIHGVSSSRHLEQRDLNTARPSKSFLKRGPVYQKKKNHVARQAEDYCHRYLKQAGATFQPLHNSTLPELGSSPAQKSGVDKAGTIHPLHSYEHGKLGCQRITGRTTEQGDLVTQTCRRPEGHDRAP